MKRGDVILVRFPHPTGLRGKKRPSVIVQSDAYAGTVSTLADRPLTPVTQKEGFIVDVIVLGVVREGCVVPDSPLPEGVRVEVRLADPRRDVPAELLAEFEAWGRASDRALARVEELAEGKADAAR